jgi:hypothetical protein
MGGLVSFLRPTETPLEDGSLPLVHLSDLLKKGTLIIPLDSGSIAMERIKALWRAVGGPNTSSVATMCLPRS